MLNKNQSQQVGNDSTVIQGGNDVTIHVGLSYSDARAIALDVARSTFVELAGEARATMCERVEEITEKVITRLSTEYAPGLNKASDPDFQHALLAVQREYGRCGDKELGDLLIDLLVDRSKEENRTLLQIVLNESLNIAPKLTHDQFASLTLIFLIRNTKNFTIENHETFGKYLDQYIQPFIEGLSTANQTYQHLEFTGCGSRQPMMHPVEDQILENYSGLFLRGHSKAELINLKQEYQDTLFMPCLIDNSKSQFRFIDLSSLVKHLTSQSTPQTEIDSLSQLFNANKLAPEEVKKKCCEVRPYMADFFDKWQKSDASDFSLTSVGIAIAHANMKRHMPDFSELSTWI